MAGGILVDAARAGFFAPPAFFPKRVRRLFRGGFQKLIPWNVGE